MDIVEEIGALLTGRPSEHWIEPFSQAADEIDRLRAELAALRKHARNLSEIVRMPNAEHVADAHNAAVRAIKAALAAMGSADS